MGRIWSTAIDEWWDRYGYGEDLRSWFWSVMQLVDQTTLERARQASKT